MFIKTASEDADFFPVPDVRRRSAPDGANRVSVARSVFELFVYKQIYKKIRLRGNEASDGLDARYLFDAERRCASNGSGPVPVPARVAEKTAYKQIILQNS